MSTLKKFYKNFKEGFFSSGEKVFDDLVGKSFYQNDNEKTQYTKEYSNLLQQENNELLSPDKFHLKNINENEFEEYTIKDTNNDIHNEDAEDTFGLMKYLNKYGADEKLENIEDLLNEESLCMLQLLKKEKKEEKIKDREDNKLQLSNDSALSGFDKNITENNIKNNKENSNKLEICNGVYYEQNITKSFDAAPHVSDVSKINTIPQKNDNITQTNKLETNRDLEIKEILSLNEKKEKKEKKKKKILNFKNKNKKEKKKEKKKIETEIEMDTPEQWNTNNLSFRSNYLPKVQEETRNKQENIESTKESIKHKMFTSFNSQQGYLSEHDINNEENSEFIVNRKELNANNSICLKKKSKLNKSESDEETIINDYNTNIKENKKSLFNNKRRMYVLKNNDTTNEKIFTYNENEEHVENKENVQNIQNVQNVQNVNFEKTQNSDTYSNQHNMTYDIIKDNALLTLDKNNSNKYEEELKELIMCDMYDSSPIKFKNTEEIYTSLTKESNKIFRKDEKYNHKNIINNINNNEEHSIYNEENGFNAKSIVYSSLNCHLEYFPQDEENNFCMNYTDKLCSFSSTFESLQTLIYNCDKILKNNVNNELKRSPSNFTYGNLPMEENRQNMEHCIQEKYEAEQEIRQNDKMEIELEEDKKKREAYIKKKGEIEVETKGETKLEIKKEECKKKEEKTEKNYQSIECSDVSCVSDKLQEKIEITKEQLSANDSKSLNGYIKNSIAFIKNEEFSNSSIEQNKFTSMDIRKKNKNFSFHEITEESVFSKIDLEVIMKTRLGKYKKKKKKSRKIKYGIRKRKKKMYLRVSYKKNKLFFPKKKRKKWKIAWIESLGEKKNNYSWVEKKSNDLWVEKKKKSHQTCDSLVYNINNHISNAENMKIAAIDNVDQSEKEEANNKLLQLSNDKNENVFKSYDFINKGNKHIVLSVSEKHLQNEKNSKEKKYCNDLENYKKVFNAVLELINEKKKKCDKTEDEINEQTKKEKEKEKEKKMEDEEEEEEEEKKREKQKEKEKKADAIKEKKADAIKEKKDMNESLTKKSNFSENNIGPHYLTMENMINKMINLNKKNKMPNSIMMTGQKDRDDLSNYLLFQKKGKLVKTTIDKNTCEMEKVIKANHIDTEKNKKSAEYQKEKTQIKENEEKNNKNIFNWYRKIQNSLDVVKLQLKEAEEGKTNMDTVYVYIYGEKKKLFCKFHIELSILEDNSRMFKKINLSGNKKVMIYKKQMIDSFLHHRPLNNKNNIFKLYEVEKIMNHCINIDNCITFFTIITIQQRMKKTLNENNVMLIEINNLILYLSEITKSIKKVICEFQFNKKETEYTKTEITEIFMKFFLNITNVYNDISRQLKRQKENLMLIESNFELINNYISLVQKYFNFISYNALEIQNNYKAIKHITSHSTNDIVNEKEKRQIISIYCKLMQHLKNLCEKNTILKKILDIYIIEVENYKKYQNDYYEEKINILINSKCPYELLMFSFMIHSKYLCEISINYICKHFDFRKFQEEKGVYLLILNDRIKNNFLNKIKEKINKKEYIQLKHLLLLNKISKVSNHFPSEKPKEIGDNQKCDLPINLLTEKNIKYNESQIIKNVIKCRMRKKKNAKTENEKEEQKQKQKILPMALKDVDLFNYSDTNKENISILKSENSLFLLKNLRKSLIKHEDDEIEKYLKKNIKLSIGNEETLNRNETLLNETSPNLQSKTVKIYDIPNMTYLNENLIPLIHRKTKPDSHENNDACFSENEHTRNGICAKFLTDERDLEKKYFLKTHSKKETIEKRKGIKRKEKEIKRKEKEIKRKEKEIKRKEKEIKRKEKEIKKREKREKREKENQVYKSEKIESQNINKHNNTIKCPSNTHKIQIDGSQCISHSLLSNGEFTNPINLQKESKQTEKEKEEKEEKEEKKEKDAEIEREKGKEKEKEKEKNEKNEKKIRSKLQYIKQLNGTKNAEEKKKNVGVGTRSEQKANQKEDIKKKIIENIKNIKEFEEKYKKVKEKEEQEKKKKKMQEFKMKMLTKTNNMNFLKNRKLKKNEAYTSMIEKNNNAGNTVVKFKINSNNFLKPEQRKDITLYYSNIGTLPNVYLKKEEILNKINENTKNFKCQNNSEENIQNTTSLQKNENNFHMEKKKSTKKEHFCKILRTNYYQCQNPLRTRCTNEKSIGISKKWKDLQEMNCLYKNNLGNSNNVLSLTDMTIQVSDKNKTSFKSENFVNNNNYNDVYNHFNSNIIYKKNKKELPNEQTEKKQEKTFFDSTLSSKPGKEQRKICNFITKQNSNDETINHSRINEKLNNPTYYSDEEHAMNELNDAKDEDSNPFFLEKANAFPQNINIKYNIKDFSKHFKKLYLIENCINSLEEETCCEEEKETNTIEYLMNNCLSQKKKYWKSKQEMEEFFEFDRNAKIEDYIKCEKKENVSRLHHL